MNLLVFIFSLISVTAFADQSCSQGRKIESVEVEAGWAEGFKKTTWTVRASCDPLDRFQFHRVEAIDLKNTYEKKRVFLIPGEGWGFQDFETSLDYLPSGAVNRATSFAGSLASEGHIVFGFTPRAQLIPGKCEPCNPLVKACPKGPLFDCNTMKTWDFESLLQDSEFALNQIRMLPPFTNPVVGGVSLGALMSIALVNRQPQNFEGLFIWEGLLTTKDEALKERNLKQCKNYTEAVNDGNFIESQGMGLFKKLYENFKIDPTGPSPFGEFLGLPLGASHEDVFYYALTMDQPEPFNERYIYAVGDWKKHRFDFASVDIVGQAIRSVGYYIPIAEMRDYTCAIAGERDYVSNLASFKGPVLAIGQEFGFGKAMEDNLKIFASKDQVQFIYYPGMGHGDGVFSANRKTLIDQPVFNWLEKLK